MVQAGRCPQLNGPVSVVSLESEIAGFAMAGSAGTVCAHISNSEHFWWFCENHDSENLFTSALLIMCSAGESS